MCLKGQKKLKNPFKEGDHASKFIMVFSSGLYFEKCSSILFQFFLGKVNSKISDILDLSSDQKEVRKVETSLKVQNNSRHFSCLLFTFKILTGETI